MKRVIALITCALIVGGCADSFKYNDVTYSSRENALTAARSDVAQSVSGVPIVREHIGGSLVLVVPTREVIDQYGVTKTGSPSSEVVDYIVDVLELGFTGVADGVKAGHTFDAVTVVRVSDVESYPVYGYDYALKLVGSSPTQWQWYLTSRNGSGKMPVTFDQNLVGSRRLSSFNESLIRASIALGAAPVASVDVTAPEKHNSPNRIALRSSGGTFVVPVTINNQITLDFVIDSGAADVSVPADVVMTLLRTKTLTSSDFLGTQNYMLADGRTMPSQRFRIRWLKVGNKVLQDVTASVAPVNGSLLLGQSFFARLKSWSIDNRTKVLLLE